MCGRFVDPNFAEISETKIDPFKGWKRRYNIKPTQDVWTFDDDGAPALARWWLIPSWHKGDLKDWKATTFNARIEDAAKKPAYRGPWKYGRCLIPAGGYYEWTGEKGSKQPHFIRNAGNEETLWFAGLSSVWQDMLTCTIVTRAANDMVDAVHHRMPVILNTEERDAWLGGSDDPDIGAGVQLRHHPVSKFGAKDDGPELIEEE
ncbi:SOS response-associated peptidase [Paracoccus onubensis]|uniref:SOS response-associated peptidase n=1 Tax=Paracoccus onubensis TaxID=1675788 RepID=UPI00272F465E|nr:SOS response-associated peptidase [Paracoccus onubensis]MDP0925693.1 SOS response-associated peptidase [Paracoccus onubensis]